MSGFLDIAGAAAFLGLSPRSIRRRLEVIPHYRADFGLRFSTDDLSAYMANFRKEPVRAAKVNLEDVLGPRKRRAG